MLVVKEGRLTVPPIATLLLKTTLPLQVRPPTVVRVLEKTVFVPVVVIEREVFPIVSPMLTDPTKEGAVLPVLTVKL